MFINYFYLPYKARTDVYRELDDVVFDGNNRQLTPSEIQELERYLNNGAYKPSTGGTSQKTLVNYIMRMIFTGEYIEKVYVLSCFIIRF